MAGQNFTISRSRLLYSRLRIMRAWGVTVLIHWSWFPCLLLWLRLSVRGYSGWIWAFCEILGLFLIVLMHEVGHMIATRWLSLKANEIILWPLGGLALIDPPKRWRAELLISSGGPLVNVALVPITFLSWYWIGYQRGGDLSLLLWQISWANASILLFNLLPIWPLDGGRIFRTALTGRLGPSFSGFTSAMLGIISAAIGIIVFMHIHAYMAVAVLTALIFLDVGLL
jgi:Zn-dependent protease